MAGVYILPVTESGRLWAWAIFRAWHAKNQEKPQNPKTHGKSHWTENSAQPRPWPGLTFLYPEQSFLIRFCPHRQTVDPIQTFTRDPDNF